MTEIGATISPKGGSNVQVTSLTKTSVSMKRGLGFTDGMILSGSMNDNARVITGDKRFVNFMQQMGWPSSIYNLIK